MQSLGGLKKAVVHVVGIYTLVIWNITQPKQMGLKLDASQ